MRVLFDYVAATEPVWGGIEEHVCALGAQLASQGHELSFLPRAPYSERHRNRFADAGIRPLQADSLWKTLRRERVDVYHIHSNLHGHEVFAAATARLAGVGATIITYHCLPGRESARRRRVMSAMHRWLDVRAIGVSTAVTDAIEVGYALPAGRIQRVFNGVDDPMVRHSWRVQPPGSPVRVGVVARLSVEKGVDIFIRALSLLDARLPMEAHVYGDGDLLPILRDYALELGVAGRVAFEPSTVRPLEELDLLVVPSRSEGFGLVAAEACARGLPIVAARVGGLLDLVRDGENGRLVPPEDPAAMARAIHRAVLDPGWRRQAGIAGRQHYEQYFRSEAMAAATARVYEQALRRHWAPTARHGELYP